MQHLMQKNPSGRLSLSVIVVGAGPAGMMAAIAAASGGARVTLCDQLARPGVKLLATGGGRCNLTNTLPDVEFMAAFGRNGRFMQSALRRLNATALRDFLAEHGVPTHSPDGFRVYPVSNSSATVQRALHRLCTERGVTIRCGTRVAELVASGSRVTGIRTGRETLPADRVVLATGGRSYPDLGGTGSGYDLARRAGHTLSDLLPVLTPLFTRETWPAACAGASVADGRAWIDEPRYPREGCRGDLLFTHQGLSGPVILDLSRHVAPFLNKKRSVRLRVELAPGTTAPEWIQRLDRWHREAGRRRIVGLLDEHLPARLAAVAADVAGISPETTAAEVTRDQRRRLADTLAGATLTATGCGGWDVAMVTRGGVNLKEVDPQTLQSRILKGLFFAGEVLDLDGPSGGYNLQWAFSSGWLAGHSALT